MIASGNQKYIGARYVPIIMGDWSASTKYEPLMVVLYQGTSYTSKTTVPAGVLPTVEEYWAKTGDYNAQVEQYRQEVISLSDVVLETSNKVNFLSNYVTPQMFGAKGDGITDDTIAIQNTLDNYDNIYFPKGTYIVGALFITRMKCTLKGEGRTKTILKLKSGATVNALLSLNSKFGCTISNIGFDGNKANSTSIYGIFEDNALTRGDRYYLSHIQMTNFTEYGCYVKCINGVWINDFEAYYCGKTGLWYETMDSQMINVGAWDCKDCGINIAGSNNQISNIRCDFCGVSNDYTTTGIKISGGNNVITNAEAQCNLATGFIVTSNNNILTGILSDANGKNTGDTDSSGIIINGNYNIINCKLRCTFSNFINTQIYAIKGIGEQNTITYDSRDTTYGNNKIVDISQIKNKITGNITPELPLTFSAINPNATFIGKAYLKNNLVKINAIVNVTTNIGFSQILFKLTNSDITLTFDVVHYIQLRKSDNSILYELQNAANSGNIFTGSYNLPIGTYILECVMEL